MAEVCAKHPILRGYCTLLILDLDSERHADYFFIDEIAALVLDPGTYVTRSGFAGEDTPKSVIPSSYAFIPQEDAEKNGGKVLPGDNAVNSLAEGLEIRNFMSEGIGTQFTALLDSVL